MFERFTDRARRVIVLAQEEARILNHNYIGTEHLLLGLVHEGEGVAAEALDGLGISLEAVREQVGEIIGRGSRPLSGHIPFTPRAKKVLELSLREALDLGHNFIGPEHILLGLIREGGGVAAQVLVNLGGDLEHVRDRVAALVSGAGAGAGRPAAQRRPMRVAEAPPAQLEQILHALGMIDARLAAIEQHLGLRPSGAAPEGTARPDEPPGAARAAPGDPARPAAPPGDPGEPAAG